MQYKVNIWSKSSCYKAKNNLVSHARLNYPQYVPSYYVHPEPINMWELMSFGYGRQYNKERIAFIRKQQEELLAKQAWFKERQKRIIENVKKKRFQDDRK